MTTQEDREAAAWLLGGASPVGLLDGYKDSLSLVQAFAAHRIAAERRERAATLNYLFRHGTGELTSSMEVQCAAQTFFQAIEAGEHRGG